MDRKTKALPHKAWSSEKSQVGRLGRKGHMVGTLFRAGWSPVTDVVRSFALLDFIRHLLAHEL